jgi:uncharacterized protein YkwD
MGRGTGTALLLTYASAATVVGALLAAAPAHAGGDQGAAVLNQINVTRAANGCGPVAANPQLTASATRQANDMLMNGVQGHTGSDGSSPAQRIRDAGPASYTRINEIVFWSTGPGGGTPAAAITWWMNSPRHRAVITDCALTDAGFSAVSSGDRFTVAGDFGKR